MLSFTALNDAINKLPFDQSNRKCNITPKIAQKINEKRKKFLIDNFFI